MHIFLQTPNETYDLTVTPETTINELLLAFYSKSHRAIDFVPADLTTCMVQCFSEEGEMIDHFETKIYQDVNTNLDIIDYVTKRNPPPEGLSWCVTPYDDHQVIISNHNVVVPETGDIVTIVLTSNAKSRNMQVDPRYSHLQSENKAYLFLPEEEEEESPHNKIIMKYWGKPITKPHKSYAIYTAWARYVVIFAGRKLVPDGVHTLADYRIERESRLFLYLNLRGS